MRLSRIDPATNLLVMALPDNDRCIFLSCSEPVDLVPGDVLGTPGDPVHHVYFPTTSIISLCVPLTGGSGLEVAMIGNEGMLGVTLILDVGAAPFDAVVQGAGGALRLSTASFLQLLARSPVLHRELRRYLYVSMIQLAQTVACTRFHVVEARLARWLLMTHDRAHCDTFHVTHAFLACRLGVRRVGITKAATSLQRQRLIHYHRGDITVLDRGGLERASCECYGAGTEAYARIVGCYQGREVDT
jgi:CRP-like cAMP-binding protein